MASSGAVRITATPAWGISSAGRALAWHARGHRFDPGILHHKDLTEICQVFFAALVKNCALYQKYACSENFSKTSCNLRQGMVLY